MARIRAVMSERERNLRTLGESEADLPGLWLYRVSDPDDVIGRRLVLNDNRKQHWIVTDCDQTKGVLVLERYSRTNGSVTEVLRLEQYWNSLPTKTIYSLELGFMMILAFFLLYFRDILQARWRLV